MCKIYGDLKHISKDCTFAKQMKVSTIKSQASIGDRLIEQKNE